MKLRLQVLESLGDSIRLSHDKGQKIAHPEKCLALEILELGKYDPQGAEERVKVEWISLSLKF